MTQAAAPNSQPSATFHVPRSERFPIRAVLRYRTVGEREWLTGTTENISGTGVLFQADRAPELDTPLEINLTLAVELAHTPVAEVICVGRVVRIVPDDSQRTHVAASINNYRFMRPGE